MPRHFQHHIQLDQINSIDDVCRELEHLNNRLTGSELHELAVFNKAYLVVTQNVQAAARHRAFEKPDIIEKLDIAFAHFYFDALNQFNKTGDLPGIWGKNTQRVRHTKHPAFIALLMGANAHINHDLALALLNTKVSPADLHEDFARVNNVLLRCSYDILATFDEPDQKLNFIKRRLQLVYLKPVMFVVLRWRKRAWIEFEHMYHQKCIPHDYQNRSYKIAGILQFWRTTLS
jgi:hypothetical protein